MDSLATLDEAAKGLAARKDTWVKVQIPERIAILDRIGKDLLRISSRWIEESLSAKGIHQGTYAEGEEWAMLTSTFRQVRLLREALVDILEAGRPSVESFTVLPNGQVTAHVFPRSIYDRIILRGITGDVWMEPGRTVEDVLRDQARVYHTQNRRGQVVLVLGAGNASCLVPGDFLYKLFVEDQVVLLKLNPVNAYLGPLIEEGFAALVQGGFLRVVQGGAEEGAYLCQHAAVDEIHMTGSDKTFEAIVFGPGPEGERRKAQHKPLLTKRFTAELGNITPVIIVPGPWSADDIEEQALDIVSWHVANAAFNCHTPRVIITHKHWPGREAFLSALERVLADVATRRAYYPHSREIHAAFLAAHPEAHRFGTTDDQRTPWTLISDVDPRDSTDICFRTEPYCSLFSETALEAPDVPGFLDTAVAFANDVLWGTLYAGIYVHPKSAEDPRTSDALERAIAALRYGMIGVNMRADIAYFIMLGPWGGYPSRDIYDVQSGINFTNNTLMFDRPQKSVWRAPFHKSINPATVRSTQMCRFFRDWASFEATQSIPRFAKLLWTASMDKKGKK